MYGIGSQLLEYHHGKHKRALWIQEDGMEVQGVCFWLFSSDFLEV